MFSGTHSNDIDARGWHDDIEIVDRHISADWERIRARLSDPAALVDLPKHFDQHIERVDRLAEIWRAAGRIERHGRLERIEIEVSQASSYSADLRVLPWKEHRIHWGHHRRDWLLEIADHLETALTGEFVEVISRLDVMDLDFAPGGASA